MVCCRYGTAISHSFHPHLPLRVIQMPRIATRLVREGFNPQVYDAVDIAVRMFTNDVGGMMSGSPKVMAQGCDVIITVLPRPTRGPL